MFLEYMNKKLDRLTLVETNSQRKSYMIKKKIKDSVAKKLYKMKLI